jgi:polysaccharide export outer membrane protein
VTAVPDGDRDLSIWSWLRAVARPTTIILGLGIGLGGCTALPGDGPWMGGAQATSTEALPFDVIDLTPTTVVGYRQPSIDRPSSTSNLSAAVPVSVGPGDVLRVRIFERYGGNIFPTIQTGAPADLGVQRVAENGTVNVPFVGTVQVAGLDLHQIEQRIVQQLGNRVQEPEVIVDFAAPRAHTVMISGDVKKPGRMSILDDIRTVVDAINAAGGLAGAGQTGMPPTNQVEVVVRRQGQVILTAQLSDLLAGNDIPVQRGDEIVVRPNPRVYTVLGAVLKSGNVEMTKANLSLLEALGNVGGLRDERANKTGVYVFRMGDLQNNPTARGRVFRLDLFQPVSIFVAQQFGVQARDVVYVTNAPLYEYDKILTSLYRTFSIIGVARGNIIPTTTF